MNRTMLSAVVSLLAAGVLMGGCMADTGGKSESEEVAAEGPNVSGGEEVGEAKQALTSQVLPLAANANFEFETGPNKDLYVIIKAGTFSGKTELHVLTAASNYTQFSVHTATGLHVTGANWAFEVDKATGDLYCIARGPTGSKRTEIHVLSASSNWQTFTVHQPTAFGIHLPLSDFEWHLAANRDLFLIDKRGTSVRAAQAASNWQRFNAHAVSALGPTGAAWGFDLTPSRNVVALTKQGGASGTTEVHSLAAGTNYQSFAFQTATELPPGDDAWQYDVTADCKLFGIKRWGTVSGQAELKITQLTGAVCGPVGAGWSGVTAIAGGIDHNLAVKNNGTIWAWGDNGSGQVGNGTTTGPTLVGPVGGNLAGVVAVAGGGSLSLAVKSDSTIWAWGDNGSGQVGDGTTTNRTTPVRANLAGVLAVATGGWHSVALKSDGTVWSWGRNDYGQVGDGTTVDRTTPVKVVPLEGVVAVATGGWHSVALKSDGTVWTWGSNATFQLGDGTTTNRTTPVQVNLTGVVAVAAAGYHTLALRSDGTVWTWGGNEFGQLGDGTTTYRSTPVKVVNLTGVVAVAAGFYHSVAVKIDGTVRAWGYNDNGQLGDGTTTDRSTPGQVSTLARVVAVVAGGDHTLALKSDGTVWAWGLNSLGQLGDGTTTNRSTPALVPGL